MLNIRTFQLVLIAGLLTASLPTAPIARADADDDKAAKIQAAFLLNFVRYTTWPVERFEAEDSPIEIAVIGPDAMGSTLDATVADKQVHGRSIVVRRYAWPDRDRLTEADYAARVEALLVEAGRAEMVFISEPLTWRLPRFAERLSEAGTLVVGMSRQAAEQGAALSLAVEDNRMVFYANASVIGTSRYDVSSRLLKLARLVEEER